MMIRPTPKGKSCSEGAVTAWLMGLRRLAIKPTDQLLRTQLGSLQAESGAAQLIHGLRMTIPTPGPRLL